MKLVLRGDVEGLGRTGDVVDVAPGYFRNYLMPNGLAIRATSAAEAAAESTRRVRAEKHAADRSDAEEVASRLVSTPITVAARAGEGDRLFGSVTAADVAEAIELQTGMVVDRKQIEIADPIKTIGQHTATANLHPEVQFPVTVEVVHSD